MQFGVTQARLDQFDVLPRRGDASLGLLLEGVKHIHDAGKPDRINRPVRITVEILNQFQYRTAAKSSQRFRSHRFAALLHCIQSKAEAVLHLGGETPQVFQT